MARNKDKKTPWVRIIIVNYNSGNYLRECVKSLLSQIFEDFEAVIVDNGSTDASLDGLPDDPRLRIARLNKNLGFATANNRGAEGCESPWIATLNPDTLPAETWLQALHEATEAYPQVAMFGSTQVMLGEPDRLDGCGDVYSFLGIPWRGGYGHPLDSVKTTGETFSPCAAAALYARRAFDDAGGFDESFFCYLEDIDLGFRLRLLGERCIQVRDAVVRHEGSASSGRRSYFTLFHSARNRVWVILKNMPLCLLVPLLPLHILATFWLLYRVHDPSWRRATFAGVRASLASIPAVMRARARIQRRRRIGALEIARALNWNINALRERRPDIRALPLDASP